MKKIKSQTRQKQNRRAALCGLIAGLMNGLLGTGGGMILVPFLEKLTGSGATDKAHATSVAVIAPICAVSGAVYFWRGQVEIADILPYLWWVLPGAAVGAWLLPKIKSVWLHRIFGGFVLYAAVKMLWAAFA